MDMPTVGQQTLFARIVDTGDNPDGYKVECVAGAGSKIVRVDDGVNTTLGATFTFNLSDGDKMGLEIIGDDITCYRYTGGAWGAAIATRADATYTGAGYFGVEMSTDAVRMDNMSGGTVSGGGGTLSITVSDTAGSSESVVVSIPVSQLNIGWLNIHNG
jgi:hypothetical protein